MKKFVFMVLFVQAGMAQADCGYRIDKDGVMEVGTTEIISTFSFEKCSDRELALANTTMNQYLDKLIDKVKEEKDIAGKKMITQHLLGLIGAVRSTKSLIVAEIQKRKPPEGGAKFQPAGR